MPHAELVGAGGRIGEEALAAIAADREPAPEPPSAIPASPRPGRPSVTGREDPEVAALDAEDRVPADRSAEAEDPSEPAASADTCGIAATAEPTPSAIANRPTRPMNLPLPDALTTNRRCEGTTDTRTP